MRENPPETLWFLQELEIIEMWHALRILSVLQHNTYKSILEITPLVNVKL